MDELQNLKQEVAQRFEELQERDCRGCDHCLKPKSHAMITSTAGSFQDSSEEYTISHRDGREKFIKRLDRLGEPMRTIYEHEKKLFKDLGLPEDPRPRRDRTF